MSNPDTLTILFPDWHIGAYWSANNTVKRVKFYEQGDYSHDHGNTAMKLDFANTCTDLGFDPRSDYWCVQIENDEVEIEYANGHPNQTIGTMSDYTAFVDILNKWDKQIRVDEAEEERLASIPTWDEIRSTRDSLLNKSDAIFAYATETGNPVPSEWTTYRQELRDLPTTFGANTGNTELVVYPTKPTWPSWS